MAGSEKHSANLGVRKHHASKPAGEPVNETIERAQSRSARAQLAAIAAGVSTRTHHYGIKSQPHGQKPPAKEEERPKH